MKARDVVKLIFAVLLTVVAVWTLVLFAQAGDAIRRGAEQVDGIGEAIGFTFAALFLALFGLIGGGISIVASLITILICSFGARREIRVKENGIAVKIPRERWVRVIFWVILGTNIAAILTNTILFIILGH